MSNDLGDFGSVPGVLVQEPEFDPLALVVADALREGIWFASATAPRSRQKAIGFSELGNACDRALAYKLRDTAPVRHSDPLKSIVGIGGHLVLAEYFRRLDAGTGRYLVEYDVAYRGIPGTVDLVDRRRKAVIDWKFKDLTKVRRARREGPPIGYRVQAHGYGTALAAMGEEIEHVGLCYIPVNGELNDIWLWMAPLDPSIADGAIARVADLGNQILRYPDLGDIKASPTPLCPWCPWHQPKSQDLNKSCPGKGEKS